MKEQELRNAIRQLLDEARNHSDHEQVASCRRALAGNKAAMAQCVDVIEYAESMEREDGA